LVASGSGNGLFEGPVWIAARGVLLFSDIDLSSTPNPSTLRELTPPNSLRPLLTNAGTNGLALASSGRVIGAAHDVQGIVSIDPATGAKVTVLSKYQGKNFNSPNDVAVRSDGTIYFTDPDYQLGGRAAQLGFTGVFRCSADGQTVVLVSDALPEPNGITLSPDEKFLYVAVMGSNKVVRFAVASDGSTSAMQDFVNVTSPDGVGMDCAGNLYVASHEAGQISVFAPSGGAAITKVSVAPKTTNIAFGGSDRKTLYVTAGKALYLISSDVPGYPN
jgi:gluconolactonase